ncbi:dUTP diphosphatase [Biformimicrobium ophioploci]|uniref:dUTPase n=1 Tax=Biformimicrobium ophioploci TaxID=3036711 RepID=A0ABQ6M1Q2_9GAMM|nr:dUTP diphosphatase [Microbulbifer sp. NKW57]GMG88281.1 dUTPase [Microbulbifer sp. NKW57]
MKQQLTTMLALQDEINTVVNADWRAQGFAWYRAIWVESAELLDHYGWKWWKKQQPEMDQVKLELVDIWHFGLSLELQKGDAGHVAAEMDAKLSDLALAPGDFRENLEAFTLATLQAKAFDLPGFAQLMCDVEMDFDELYRRYVGKNVLNRFRQDHGYQTGTYIKNWQGREDNEHLAEVCDSLDAGAADFKDQVYQALQARYPAGQAA